MGPAYLRLRGLRLSPAANLALRDQLAHPERHLFHGFVVGNAVLIVKVDIVRAQTAQRILHGQAHSASAELALGHVLTGQRKRRKLHRQHDAVAKRLHGPPHKFLVHKGPVSFRSIEKGAAELKGSAYEPHGLIFRRADPVAVRKAHAAHAHGRNFQTAASQPSFFHVVPPLRPATGGSPFSARVPRGTPAFPAHAEVLPAAERR